MENRQDINLVWQRIVDEHTLSALEVGLFCYEPQQPLCLTPPLLRRESFNCGFDLLSDMLLFQVQFVAFNRLIMRFFVTLRSTQNDEIKPQHDVNS